MSVTTYLKGTIAMSSSALVLHTFALVSGKGVTAADKVRQHVSNGAELGALVAVKVGRKAILDDMQAQGMSRTVHALASGNIRPAVALVVARAGKAETVLTEDGKAPYSEWVRLGAVLATRVQYTTSGKPTSANKALALHTSLTMQADSIRASRMAQRGIEAPEGDTVEAPATAETA